MQMNQILPEPHYGMFERLAVGYCAFVNRYPQHRYNPDTYLCNTQSIFQIPVRKVGDLPCEK
jgi:hypothetical protein